MPPRKKSGGKGSGAGKKGSRSDETGDYELGDDFLADIDDEEEEEVAEDEEVAAEHEDDEAYDDEELEDDEDSELDEVVSAETQEWEGIEAEGDEDEAEGQPTVVASAGARVREAGSAITSGFEALPGSDKVTSGFKSVRGWRPGFPLWLRFTTASLSIVVSVAAATAASLILYLGDIAEGLQHDDLPGVNKFLTQVPSSGPQTILILGSDKRPEDGGTYKGLSDTTMLLRLDPGRNAIALFSLPRDLEVSIPGYGTDKLNAAYAFGGPQLTLQTVEGLTGLEVNHLVNVDFEGFARAVNALDCVYVDVDHRYFHSNLETVEQYEEIDLQPGYQALCGFDALDYARYRHTDNDVVRAARQQEFLREARAKIPPERLFEDRKELISIFTEHTSSDISDSQTMLQVLKLFLDARDAPVKEVHFEGTLGPSFVTATPAEIQTAVDQFLGFTATPGGGQQSAEPESPVAPEAAPDQTPVVPTGKKAKAPAPAPPPDTGGAVDNTVSLTPTSYGKELAKSVRARVTKLPIFYPTALETGSDFAQKPRVYKVNGTGEDSPPATERSAYKWVFSRPALGEYYGFEATRWRDPPILNDPDSTKTIGDREYMFYFDGDRVRMVAWQDDEGSYWLSNTLVESLSDQEMLKLAQGFRELPRVG